MMDFLRAALAVPALKVADVAFNREQIQKRMEQAAENMIAFEYDGDLYWGLGQCEDGSFVRKIYRRDMKRGILIVVSWLEFVDFVFYCFC